MASISPRVLDPARVAAVRASGLLDTPPEEDFDRLTALAAGLTGAMVSFITLVDDQRSFWKSVAGLPAAERREDPLEMSFSRHVLAAGAPVVVEDAGAPGSPQPVPTIDGHDVGAWVGVPVRAADGHLVGAFCVADREPRGWSDADVLVLEALAVTARGEIELRRALAETRDAVAALERLHQASTALVGALTFEQIAEVALAEALGALGARAAHIAITDPSGTRFVASRAAGFPEPQRQALERLDPGQSVLSAEAARTWRPVWVTGEEWVRRFPDSARLGAALGSEAAAIPLISGDRLLGVLGLVFDRPDRARTAGERALAVALAGHCAQAMERGRLYDRAHRTAEVLQRSILPGRLPEVTGLEVAARYVPSGEGSRVGGDFFDLFPVGPSRWGAVVGDVCGKGPEAAAVTAQARHVIRAHARIGRWPADVLSHLNDALIEDRRSFLTAVHLRFRAEADGIDGTLAVGGHPPPLVLRAGGEVEALGAPGSLIGVLDQPRLRDVPFALGPGDALVLYTDGVTEARRDGVQLGVEGLRGVLAGCDGLGAEEIAARIGRAVRDHAGAAASDDLALLVMRRLR